jgi:hypothetical protein
MSHLPTDRLAALGDEEPTPTEAAHIASCAVCAGERAAYRALIAMARAERESFGLPLTRWESIVAAMAGDTPLVAPSAVATESSSTRDDARRFAGRRATRFPLQAAAGLLLVAGGVLAGRASAGARLLPAASVIDSSATPTRPIDTPVASASLQSSDSTFGSIEEARFAQQRSASIYQQASAFLAKNDTTSAGDGSPVTYRALLAAQDGIITTTREAMRQAPHDPVINAYYLTTLGQREATLRQMNTVMPASLRNKSF